MAAADEKEFNRQTSVLLKTIGELEVVGYHKFRKQFERAAFAFNWHDSILNNTSAPGRGDALTKRNTDAKTAMLMLLAKTDGHPIEDVLEDLTLSDAQEGFKRLHEFHHKSTAAGRARAMQDFYGSTMHNTSTNLTQWFALVSRRAHIVDMAGPEFKVSEDALLAQLLTGLLPEFKDIKTIIQNRPAQSLADTRATLLDYASEYNLMTTSKGSRAVGGKHNVFNAETRQTEVKSDDPCRMWANFKCRYRNGTCRYNHDGPGGFAGSKNDKSSANTMSSETPSCNYCKTTGSHNRSQCAKLHLDKSRGQKDSPSTNMVNATQEKPYIFSMDAKDAPKNPYMRFYTPCDETDENEDNFEIKSEPTDEPAKVSESAEKAPNRAEKHPMAAEKSPKSTDNTPTTPRKNANKCGIILSILAVIVSLFTVLFWPLPKAIFSEIVFNLTAAPQKCLTSVHYVYDSVLPPHLLSTKNRKFFWAVVFGLLFFRVTAEQDDPIHTCSAFINEAAYTAEGDVTDFEWCSDSGTNRFVTNDLDDFVQGSVIAVRTDVAVGGGSVTSEFVGTVRVKSLDYNHTIECTNVLYIPSCGKKLMPASTFIRKGCSLFYGDGDKVHLTGTNKEPILSGKEDGGLYYFHCQTEYNHSSNCDDTESIPSSSFFGLPAGKHPTSATQNFSKQLLEAHWAYGHLNFSKLRKLLGLKKGDDPHCAACTIANSRKKAMAKYAYTRSTRVNHRIHMDLGFTRNCDHMFQLYLDDWTRESHLDLLLSKTEVLPLFIDHCKLVENDHQPWKVAVFRTDGEPIYNTAAWQKFAADRGIQHELSGRHRQEQNGVAEAGMKNIGGRYRTMMIHGNSPASNIPHALIHSNVIRNWSPTKANNGWSPREKAAGMKLPVNKYLLKGPLFCLVFAHVYEQERRKHDPRGVPCVYLGFNDVNCVYLVKEWVSGRIYYTADCTFHADVFPYVANPDRSLPQLRKYDAIRPHLTAPSEPISEWRPLDHPRASARQREYQMTGDYRVADVPDVDVPPEVNLAHFESYFVHNFGDDPKDMTEALELHDADEWIKAELAEKNSFKYHEVFELVPRSLPTSRGKRIFKGKVVLKRKFHPPSSDHPLGSLDKYKYRLTIAAFTKMLTKGIDYKESHANTVRWNSIKLQLAIAVKHDLEIALIDISTFFLYGELGEDEMYMEQPPRWEDPDKPAVDYVWKLKKSMYGLPQAPHCAQNILNETLTKDNEFKATAADDCVFVATNKGTGHGSIGAHVDDMTCVGTPDFIKKVEATLAKKFKFTKTVDPKIVTGAQIDRCRKSKWLKIHQTDYVTDLLTKYGMENSTPADTPMDPGLAKTLMLLPLDDATKESTHKYQVFVGELMWAVRCRIDILFAVNMFSRFLKCATPRHLELATGRILRYLNGTRDFGIVFFPGDGDWNLSGASDADLAGDLATACSTSGRYAKMGDYGTVVAASKLERKISTSTGQSETYSFQSLAKEIIWDRLFLSELGYHQKYPTNIHTDNDGVVIQSTKAVNHATAKHYRIAQAFIRQLDRDRIIKALPIDTADNASDIFTKALPAKPFLKHRHTIMGPQTRPI